MTNLHSQRVRLRFRSGLYIYTAMQPQVAAVSIPSHELREILLQRHGSEVNQLFTWRRQSVLYFGSAPAFFFVIRKHRHSRSSRHPFDLQRPSSSCAPPTTWSKRQTHSKRHHSNNNMCGSDIFLGLVAILFPPLAVWVKRGICSADSLINIALCSKSAVSQIPLLSTI
jgi:uncharacterized membrane protein YqaE (UPF0057 family)